MELTNYLLTSFVVSLGIFSGVILGWIAKEELEPGKKYLVFLQNIIPFVLIALFIYLQQETHLIVLSVLLALIMIFRRKIAGRINYFAYIVFALIFYLTADSISFIAVSSLIFIFGFPTGSLLFMKKRWLKKGIYTALLFPVLSALFYLTTSHPLA